MRNWKNEGLRTWVLGAAATGLLCQSMPVLGQTRTSIFSNRKNVPAKPTAVLPTEPPQLLATPDANVSAANPIQPVSQLVADAGGKSEVQKQLEALYEQDGREMPSMNMTLQPIVPSSKQPQQAPAKAQARPAQQPAQQPVAAPTQKPVRPAQGYTQYQPRTQAQPYPGPSKTQPQSQPVRNFSAAIDAQGAPQPLLQTPAYTQSPAQPPVQVPMQGQPPVQPPAPVRPNALAVLLRKLVELTSR